MRVETPKQIANSKDDKAFYFHWPVGVVDSLSTDPDQWDDDEIDLIADWVSEIELMQKINERSR